MGTVTREDALFAYAYCMLMASKEKRKHLKLSELMLQHIQDKIYPYWGHLTECERLSLLFSISERKHLDTKYIGESHKLTVMVAWLQDDTTDLAAGFIIHSDKRLQ